MKQEKVDLSSQNYSYHSNLTENNSEMGLKVTKGAKYTCFFLIIFVCVLKWLRLRKSRFIAPSPTTHFQRTLQQSNGTYDEFAAKAYQNLIDRDELSYPTDLFDRARILHLYRDEGEINTVNSFEPTTLYARALQGIKATKRSDRPDPTAMMHMNDGAATYLSKIRQRAPYMMPTQDELDLAQAIRASRAQVQADIYQQTVLKAPINRYELTNDFLDKSKGWTTDTQNVHDSSVMKATKNMISKLAERNNEIISPPDEPSPSTAILRYMDRNSSKFSPECREKARFALKTIGNSQTIHSGLDHNEQQILDMVWRRSYSAENKDNADDIRDMTVRNLSDMVTDIGYEGVSQFSSVCSSGRIARTVDALTVIDQDPTFGQQGPRTVDAIRNSIFDYSQAALKIHLQRAEISPDPLIQALASSYKDPKIEVDPVVETQFKENIMNDVRSYIGENYADTLNVDTRNSILEHVDAAL